MQSERRYALLVLAGIFAVAHLDRNVLGICLNAIGAEFSLSDTQLGLLSGLVFAIVFVLAGLPVAGLAAYGNRRNIVAVSATVWGLMTILMAGAQNFTHLIAARLGVGIGESGSVAPAHSMISDLYPPERRTSALAAFATGANAGVLLAFLIGGIAGQALGWRWAFVLAGLPALLLAALLRFTVQEPVRETPPSRQARQSLMLETIAAIRHDRGLLHAMIGLALTGIVTFGALAWVPAFIIRAHSLSQAQTVIFLALAGGIVGGLGTWGSGLVADRLGAKDPRWRLGVVIVAILAAKPLVWAFLLAEQTAFALSCFVIAVSVSAVYWGPTFALLHSRVSNEMRPMATAIFLFTFNLVGLGLGPTLIGLASSMVFADHGNHSLGLSLAVIQLIGVWGVWHYWQAMKTIERA